MPNGTLELTRLSASSDTQSAGVAQRFEPDVVVTRELRFDLDWEVATTVQRIAPESGAFSIAVPQLKGERVTSEPRSAPELGSSRASAFQSWLRQDWVENCR